MPPPPVILRVVGAAPPRGPPPYPARPGCHGRQDAAPTVTFNYAMAKE